MPLIKFTDHLRKFGGMFLTDNGKIAISNPTLETIHWRHPRNGTSIPVDPKSIVETDWAADPELADLVSYLRRCHSGGVIVTTKTLVL